jgi:hypothetical protein
MKAKIIKAIHPINCEIPRNELIRSIVVPIIPMPRAAGSAILIIGGLQYLRIILRPRPPLIETTANATSNCHNDRIKFNARDAENGLCPT